MLKKFECPVEAISEGEIYNIDTVNHTVDLDCEGVILTFERAAIHHIVTESAATNNEVYTDEVATEEE